MHRRLFLQFPSTVVAMPLAQAAAPKVIGILNAYHPNDVRESLDLFDRAMLALGYAKGTHYVTIERMASGRNELLREMAEELVRSKVDLICAAPSNAVAEAQRATSTVPIVFVAVTDPVGEGFADSLAPPGRKLTGVSNNVGDLGPKRLQLLKLMVPGLTRLALLVTPRTPTFPTFLPRFRLNASALGCETVLVEAPLPLDLAMAFNEVARAQCQAIYVAGDPYLWSERRHLADLALRYRLPTIFAFVEHVEAGGLISYGADQKDWMRQSASFVDKIFRGSKPGELPIEQPSKFDLFVNRRPANELKLPIPSVLALQATRVID
jgi:putative ABC transport system substrate-binding protein